MQMLDDHLPVTTGTELLLTRHSDPDNEIPLLLDKLGLLLPSQPPPHIRYPLPPFPSTSLVGPCRLDFFTQLLGNEYKSPRNPSNKRSRVNLTCSLIPFFTQTDDNWRLFGMRRQRMRRTERLSFLLHALRVYKNQTIVLTQRKRGTPRNHNIKTHYPFPFVPFPLKTNPHSPETRLRQPLPALPHSSAARR
ncbi:MAG: hypothetical protein LBI02_11035 [Opitutaceae bacterium]|nr:hypothetical protein [Opitutaceae bacterium]